MLVCHVSQVRRRAAISADLAEVAAALDDAGTGNVVFATLVDDPASVLDIVDAYIGEIMLEPANATDSFDAGSSYTVMVDETGFAIATDLTSFPAAYSADVAEAASATALQDYAGAGVSLNMPILSASRAGVGSVIAAAGGKTQIISNVGAVT